MSCHSRKVREVYGLRGRHQNRYLPHTYDDCSVMVHQV